MLDVIELVVRSDAVELAATCYQPDNATAGVVMIGGSGATDRDNDVLFPPIRGHLVDHGIAVLSFDKRGVGGSTGDWREVGIDEFARDAVAALRALAKISSLDDSSIGLFGHSEGGWVALRAATVQSTAFVVINGCPGITPAAQDRYALTNALTSDGVHAKEREQALAAYDALVEAGRDGAPYSVVHTLPTPTLTHYWAELDEPTWQFLARKFDHDVRRDLVALTSPCLAVLGANDQLVPISESAQVFRDAGASVLVLSGADHRALVDGSSHRDFLPAITDWMLAHSRR